MIVFGAVLSGIEDGVGMEAFAEQKEPGRRGFLDRPNGLPSHETLSDGFGRLKPEALAAALWRWVPVALPCLAGEQIGGAGKTLRGSRTGEPAVHLMSAYAAKARWVLAPPPVGDKTHELTAIPTLLSMRELNGAVVSMDARGGQKTIARDIAEAGADQVLALTDNPPQLGEEVRLWLDTETARGRLLPEETVEKDHGRIEPRRQGLSAPIEGVPQQFDGAGLQAVGRVESTRQVGGKTTTDYRDSRGSFTDRARFAEAVRSHWAIENGQHWVLDVQFSEDANRARQHHSAENLALIRRMALKVIRHNGPSKDSRRRRKLRASLNEDYRAQLIFGPQQT